MKIAITGVSGYVGGALVRELSRLPEVRRIRGLVRSNSLARVPQDCLEVVPGDLLDEESLALLVDGADIVVHAAAKLGRGSWAEFEETNVRSTFKLARAAAAAGVSRVLLVSSIEAYGTLRGVVDERRATTFCGNAYADSKVLGERALQRALAGTRTSYVIARPGMVFGPRSEFWTVRIVDSAKRGKLEVYDSGRGSAFPIYIDDLVEGLVSCVFDATAAGKVFNFANVEPVTWDRWYRDYAGFVAGCSLKSRNARTARLLRFSPLARFRPSLRHIEVMTRCATVDCTSAKRVLGWKSSFGYEIGMRHTHEWLTDCGLV